MILTLGIFILDIVAWKFEQYINLFSMKMWNMFVSQVKDQCIDMDLTDQTDRNVLV